MPYTRQKPKEEIVSQQWTIIDKFIQGATNPKETTMFVLLRNMKVLGKQRPVLNSMGEKLENFIREIMKPEEVDILLRDMKVPRK